MRQRNMESEVILIVSDEVKRQVNSNFRQNAKPCSAKAIRNSTLIRLFLVLIYTMYQTKRLNIIHYRRSARKSYPIHLTTVTKYRQNNSTKTSWKPTVRLLRHHIFQLSTPPSLLITFSLITTTISIRPHQRTALEYHPPDDILMAAPMAAAKHSRQQHSSTQFFRCGEKRTRRGGDAADYIRLPKTPRAPRCHVMVVLPEEHVRAWAVTKVSESCE